MFASFVMLVHIITKQRQIVKAAVLVNLIISKGNKIVQVVTKENLIIYKIELTVRNPMSNRNNNNSNNNSGSNHDDEEEARRRTRSEERRRKRNESKTLKFPIGSRVALIDDDNETLTVTEYNAKTKEYTCKYDDGVLDAFEEYELVHDDIRI
eukprot:g2937.t1